MDPEGPMPLEEIRRGRRTEALRSRLPYSAVWESWLEASGELAPDFDALVPRPRLWSPVEGLAGAGEFPERATAIRERLDHWVLGSAPPVPHEPDLEVDVMAERRHGGTVDRAIEVALGTGGARIRARLLMPAEGEGFPVVLTTSPHAWWGSAALRRGWATCLVRIGEDGDDSDSLVGAYPAAGWRRLSRRAWALACAVEALRQMPEVDPFAIVAAGHGAYGRVALVAAAYDPRIAAVAASSSGLFGGIAARLCAERHYGPGIEGITRQLPESFHPRLRFFAGREHLLPTDAHELLALVAPRPVLLSTATSDPAESTWAAERTADAARPAYELLGAPAGALALRWRDGAGECTPEAWEGMLDWAEHAIGRAGTGSPAPARLHLCDGIAWPAPLAPSRPLLPAGELERAIAYALGSDPPVPGDLAAPPLPEPGHTSALLGRAAIPDGLARAAARTADGVAVDVFLPPGCSPLVLWLGPLARASGYGEGWARTTPMWELLAADGWAVACFDALGTGARLGEEAAFRRRHPGWSPLGRMVRDARGAIAAAATVAGVDARRVWVAGYGAGAVVALHLGVLDPRVAGVAAIAPTAGEAALLAREPVHDLADLLAGLAARPALVVSPSTDAEAGPGDVAAAVRAAVAAGATVSHATVPGPHRLSGEARTLLRAWLTESSQPPNVEQPPL
jgi:dienelactone hydrolase